MSQTRQIMLCGFGGQGIVLAGTMAALATIFSRVSAPPPPLIMCILALISSAPSM